MVATASTLEIQDTKEIINAIYFVEQHLADPKMLVFRIHETKTFVFHSLLNSLIKKLLKKTNF